MKVLVKSTLMALLVLTSNLLFANVENPPEALVSVKILEPGKMQLAYYGKSPEKLMVNIYNEDNQRIFNETIQSENGIKKPYNLKELPYGEYKVKVRVDGKVSMHKVMHEAPKFPGKVKMVATACEQGKIKMLLMSPYYKNFRLRIYDEDNELLFQQDIRQKNNYGRVFNFEEHKTKSVRLVLSSDREILQRKTVNL